MTLINELKAAGNLKFFLDFRKGSLLDVSGNNPSATIVGTHKWAKTARGTGLYTLSASGGSDYITISNPASVQINTGTIFAVAARTESIGVTNYTFLAAKANAYGLYFNLSAEPKSFGTYDYGTSSWKTSAFSERNTGIQHLYITERQTIRDIWPLEASVVSFTQAVKCT